MSDKYPTIDGLTLPEMQQILFDIWRCRGSHLALMGYFDATLAEVDARIRQFYEAGLAETHDFNEATVQPTDLGRQLLCEKFNPRLTRAEVERALNTLVKRADAFNSDPRRLSGVRLKLFGSALYADRESYGDIDVAIGFVPKNRSDADCIELDKSYRYSQAVLNSRYSITARGRMGSQDERDATRMMGAAIKGLALARMDLGTLETPHRILADYDVQRDAPAVLTNQLVTPVRTQKPRNRNHYPEDIVLSPQVCPPVLSADQKRTDDNDEWVRISTLLNAEFLCGWNSGRYATPYIDGKVIADMWDVRSLCPAWRSSPNALICLRDAHEWLKSVSRYSFGAPEFALTIYMFKERGGIRIIVGFGVRDDQEMRIIYDQDTVARTPLYRKSRRRSREQYRQLISGRHAVAVAWQAIVRRFKLDKIPKLQRTLRLQALLSMSDRDLDALWAGTASDFLDALS